MLVVVQVSMTYRVKLETITVYSEFDSLASSLLLPCLPPERGGKDTERLVVEDQSQRQRVIARIHDTSHLGINRTVDMTASKYYWPGLTCDVKRYVSCI